MLLTEIIIHAVFLTEILEITFDSVTITENHKKQVTHDAIIEGCTHDWTFVQV